MSAVSGLPAPELYELRNCIGLFESVVHIRTSGFGWIHDFMAPVPVCQGSSVPILSMWGLFGRDGCVLGRLAGVPRFVCPGCFCQCGPSANFGHALVVDAQLRLDTRVCEAPVRRVLDICGNPRSVAGAILRSILAIEDSSGSFAAGLRVPLTTFRIGLLGDSGAPV